MIRGTRTIHRAAANTSHLFFGSCHPGGRPEPGAESSAGRGSAPSPTHATYPSGRINTAAGALTTPSAGRS